MVVALLDLIYEAPFDPTLWGGVVEEIARQTRSRTGAFSVVDLGRCPHQHIEVHHGLDPHYVRLNETYYDALNPWLHSPVKPGEGEVFTSQELVPDDEFMKTEFYQDFMRPQDQFHLLVGIPVARCSVMTAITHLRPRRAGAFGDEERELLRGLLPHVRRALGVQRRLEAAEMDRRVSGDVLDRLPVGVVITDGQGRVIRMNSAAATLVAANDGLKLEPRGVCVHRHDESLRLAALIRSASRTSAGQDYGAGGVMRITRPSERAAYSVVVVPLRAGTRSLGPAGAACVMFIDDPERQIRPSEAALASLHGLSAAEARVAAALVAGGSPEQVARELHISIHTARSHLKRIFAKTGTHAQADLVRLLVREPVVM